MTPTTARAGLPTLTVDPEFSALCTDLSPEEMNLLEASLEADGCRDPIVTWANHDDTILDGHNRYRICRRFEIPFKTRALKLETRGDAINWIIANQLGRRNLSEEQKSYLRGKRYRAEKQQGERTDLTSPENQEKLTTAERLGKEYHVGHDTIERDAAFADAVDTIADTAGPETKRAILSGSLGANKRDVIALAGLPAEKLKKTIASGKEAIKTAAYKARHDGAPKWAQGPTPQQEARDDPGRRWYANLHKIYVLTTSLRDCGGIAKLAAKWSAEAKREYVAELKRIVGELTKWVSVLEKKE